MLENRKVTHHPKAADRGAIRPMPRDAGADGLALARRVLIATCVVVTVLLVLLLVAYAANLLLLVFAGVLGSILLRRVARLLRGAIGMGRSVSLAIVTLGLLAATGVMLWLVAETFSSRANELMTQLQAGLDALRARFPWVDDAIERLPSVGELFESGGALSHLTGFASTTFGALINVVIVVAVSLYLAAQPDLYAGGIKHLLPFRSRDRAGEVLGVLDEALGRWLLGRFALMAINGGLTALALWMLGVPLAVTLGLIAGILNFIPNFGPIIAAVPAVLIAFIQSPQLALYTALVYVAVQMVDGYLLTPLVDRKSVELPPVVTIAAQVLLGVLFGFIGLLVASPLTAAIMITVKMLYVEDVLGDPVMNESSVAKGDD
jgi:predicted PurR-regulated permease PerM